jgi:hypothetical protein
MGIAQAVLSHLAGGGKTMAGVAEDYMVQDTKNATKHCKVGFDALWRMLT